MVASKRYFFYQDKSQNGKRYPFENVKCFWHLIWKTFCHLDRTSSIKTDLQNCKLWTGQTVSQKFVDWFQLNLPYPNGKKFSTSNVKKNWHLQMDIFCHFDFFIVEEMTSNNVAKSTLLFIPGLMLLWKGCRNWKLNIKARFSDKKKYIRIQTQIYSKFIFWIIFSSL